ncbi:MAG TPA: hypothetical protein VM054_07415 [bacterium]|nr:hypothetical protein [bacterium]
MAGIRTTLEAMASLAREGAADPLVRDLAGWLMEGERWPALALRDWLADRWVMVEDPWDVELLSAPALQLDRWLQYPSRGLRGDCDDLAVLGAALALAGGLPARYCAVITGLGPIPDHVFVDVLEPPGVWVELDIMRPADGAPAIQELTLIL